MELKGNSLNNTRCDYVSFSCNVVISGYLYNELAIPFSLFPSENIYPSMVRGHARYNTPSRYLQTASHFLAKVKPPGLGEV